MLHYSDRGECHITSPPVVDPNRIDPDTGVVLPPARPPEGDWDWCDLPIIGWFCGGEPDPALPTQPSLPPFEWPSRPDAAPPIPRFGEGYEEAVDECDRDQVYDDEMCSVRYAVMGGPIYQEMEERGETLTASERAMLKAAKNDYRACKTRSSDKWAQCYKDAQDRFRL